MRFYPPEDNRGCLLRTLDAVGFALVFGAVAVFALPMLALAWLRERQWSAGSGGRS